jgi:hypothetical protein
MRKALLVLTAACGLVAALAVPADKPAATVDAQWVRHQLNFKGTRFICVGGDRCEEMRKEIHMILERLGAVDIEVGTEGATFSRALPVGYQNLPVDDTQRVQAHWERVYFTSFGRGPDPERLDYFLEDIRPNILPSFATRNMREQTGKVTVEVLRAATAQ